MIKHLYGDGAKGTKLLTMCNLWVDKKEIATLHDYSSSIRASIDEICKECKEEQKKLDELEDNYISNGEI